MRHPDCDGRKEQHHQRTSTEVDRRSGETGIEDTEWDTGGSETTTGTDVSSATECQIVENGVGVDLTDEDFEEW